MEFNNLLNEQKYSANEGKFNYKSKMSFIVIYELGSKPEVFYILKTGRLALETIVEIED